MNCKKYKVGLLFLLVAAIVCGTVFFMLKWNRDEVPADGILVKNGKEEELKADEDTKSFKAYGEEVYAQTCEADEDVPQFGDETDL